MYRRRLIVAWVVSSFLALSGGAWILGEFVSLCYRWGYQMVELRGGYVGYYTNPRYTGFAWLDRGRDEGFLTAGPAEVPPGPYKLFNRNRYWTAVYVKLWHTTALAGAATAAAWWRAIPRHRTRGRCFNCGYDLRGLPGGAGPVPSCPECGAVDDEPPRAAGSASDARGANGM
jgi:hypothetical protein